MKKLLLLIAVAALVSVGAGQAFARSDHAVAKTVTIVMKDPGCHWFSVGGKLLKSQTLSVKGPVQLVNLDEDAIVVVGPKVTRHEAVGKRLALGHGVYKITMVGQHPDDNHLKLVVK